MRTGDDTIRGRAVRRLPQHLLSVPVWLRVAVWLAVFLSPTGYFLLLMMLNSLQVPAPPESLVVALFCLVPVVALLVCGTMVWLSRVRWKVGWLVLTVLAMSFQVGILLVIIVIAVTAAIAPV